MGPTRTDVNESLHWTRRSVRTAELFPVLTFLREQSPHVIGLRVVCIVQDDVLHDDAIGFDGRTPVQLHGVWVDWMQPEVRRRSRRP